MNAFLNKVRAPFAAIVVDEVRVRARRLSTLVALLAVVAASWAIIPDPASGRALIVIQGTRLVYDSLTLGIGASALAGLLLGLAGFYLARGRTRDDLVSGVGSLLAASPVSSGTLLFARWAGALAYLGALTLVLMLTTLVLQATLGEAPLQPLVLFNTFFWILVPALMLSASLAVLCDAWRPLMGKGGDVLFFLLWIGQIMVVPATIARNAHASDPLMALDLTGLATLVHRIKDLTGTERFSLGGNTFDAALAPMALGDFWTPTMIGWRLAAMGVALLPLLLARALFHRYSPDRVRAGSVARRSLLERLNDFLRPATRLTRPLFGLAPRLPGVMGQAVADAALLLAANPLALVAMIGLFVAGMLSGPGGHAGVLTAAVAVWGVAIADFPVRDYQAATGAMSATAPGGARQRHWRQFAVAAGLGLVLTAPVLVAWLLHAPFRALVLFSGILSLSAVASLLGLLTRTGRTFLALFLFGLYLATQLQPVNWFDVVAFNGSANGASLLAQSLVAVASMGLGSLWVRRKEIV